MTEMTTTDSIRALLAPAARLLAVMAAFVLLTATPCSAGEHGEGSEGEAGAEVEPIDEDPWEGFNRPMFSFNDTLDVYILEPVAEGWDRIAPEPVKNGATNFFRNLRLPTTALNSALQGKGEEAVHAFGQFFLNSTLGIAGIFDLTEGDGFERHPEDLGQTLAVWGVESGPYTMLPVFGPSSPRDITAIVSDISGILLGLWIEPWGVAALWAGRQIHERSLILEEVRDAKETSLDYYTFVRNAYSQHRTALINDSTEVDDEQEEDLYYFDDEDF